MKDNYFIHSHYRKNSKQPRNTRPALQVMPVFPTLRTILLILMVLPIGRLSSLGSDAVASNFTTNPDLGIVNTTSDVVSDTDGLTSLREAITYANQGGKDGNTGTEDVITFDPTVFSNGTVITLGGAQLVLTGYITINGDANADGLSDVTVDGNGSSRVFSVSGGRASLNYLVITNGKVETSSDSKGGGMYVNFGATVHMDHCAVLNNAAGVASTDRFFAGAGIYNVGDLTITNCTIAENSLHSNNANGSGIYNVECLTISNSTISGNNSSAIFTYASDSKFSATNVTIANNSGMGLYLFDDAQVTEAELINVTISGNGGTGIFSRSNGLAILTDCILLGNAGGELSGGTVQQNGTNIISGTVSEVFATVDVTTGGGQLADNGGPVQTIALLDFANNPAVDAASGSSIPQDDARGRYAQDHPNRTNGTGNPNGRDLGAFELSGTVTDNAIPTVHQLSPPDGATDAALDTDLTITFSEPVVAKNGYITLYDVNGGLVEQIDVTGTRVSVNGDKVTVALTNNLTTNTEYYVQIGATAFADENGNDFSGFSETWDWDFTTASMAKIYLTNDLGSKAIWRANPDGSGIEQLTDGSDIPQGIALDPVAGKVYWTSSIGNVRRADLDGNNPEDLVTGLSDPTGIVLDLKNGKMYWTQNNTGEIRRADLDGSNPENLVTGLGGLRDIALDPVAGKVYWTSSIGNVRRADLDGNNPEDLVTGLSDPTGIVLDLKNGKMYWTQNNTGEIRRADLDGSNPENLVTGLNYLEDIALDSVAGKIYWTQKDYSENIWRVDLDGNNIQEVVTELEDPKRIAIAEIVPQTISTLSPGDNAMNVAVETNLVITFSRAVAAGTGNIGLYDTNHNLVEKFDVTTDVVVSGNTVTLNPANDLSYGTSYYVQIDVKAFDDLNGNSFAGISGSDIWNFATAPERFGGPAVLNGNAELDSGTDGAPQITVDGRGNWIAVWHSREDPGGTIGIDRDILFSRSTDYGASWSYPAVLNGNAGSDSNHDWTPQVTADDAGNWVAVWGSEEDLGGTIGTDHDILFSRSTDNGTSWSYPAVLNGNAGSDSGSDWSPQVMVDDTGNLVTVWWSSEDLGGTIGTDHDILFSRSTDNGASWSYPAVLNGNAESDSGSDVYPQVTADGAGNWIAIWDSGEDLGGTIGTDRDILFSRSTDNGVSWSYPVALNGNAGSDSEDDEYPQVTVDGAGNWVTVWHSRENLDGTIGTDRDILFSRSTDYGASWSYPAALTDNAASDSGNDGSPRITVDRTGNWVTVWESSEDLGGTIGTDYDIFVATAADNTAPDILSLSPANGAMDVTIATDLVITFTEAVRAGSGNVTLYDSNGDQVDQFHVATELTISGTKVTINPANDLSYSTSYYVQIDAAAFDDTRGNSFTGIKDNTTWSFATGARPDNTPPTIAKLFPADEATDATVDTHLSITFSETVSAGSGNITLYDTNHNLVEQFDVATDVVISGAIAVINPAKNLSYGTSYYVQVDATAFDDISGNSFAGITKNTTWNFATAVKPDNTSPTIAKLFPEDETANATVNTNLMITFSESVSAGSGNITLFDAGHNLVEQFNVIAGVVISGTTVTINPSNDFLYGASYYVQIDGTAFKDMSGNFFAGITNTTTWNFVTAAVPDNTPPTLVKLFPADDAADVTVDTHLMITFSELVSAGSGNITLFDADHNLVEQFDMTSDAVISGTTVTINPSNDLSYGASYYVQIDGTAFKDMSGNFFAGITDNTTWNFNTAVLVTGISTENYPGQFEIMLFPNPTDGIFQIQTKRGTVLEVIYLYDGSGRVVHQYHGAESVVNEKYYRFDVSDLQAGSYHLRALDMKGRHYYWQLVVE